MITAARETEANVRTSCPVYGCKRTYTAMAALDDHIKDHESSAQSLPGKILLCSSPGCNSSFPDMQKLMDHVRHHYKPNIYFQCESCRTKLRSYRGLLTHLHTCSKVQSSKPKPAEAATPPPPPPAGQNGSMNPVPDHRAQRLEALAAGFLDSPPRTQNLDTFVLPAAAQTSSASSPLTASMIPSQPGPSHAWQTAEPPAEVHLLPAPDLPQSVGVAGSAVSLDPSFTQDNQDTTTGSPATASVTSSLSLSLSFE